MYCLCKRSSNRSVVLVSILLPSIKRHNSCSRVQPKSLPVGDALWIARHKRLDEEYVLDFVVERKNVNDLWSSIKDNRYRQQKLRLLVGHKFLM